MPSGFELSQIISPLNSLNSAIFSAKFLIEKHQPHVASYLGFNSGYHSRQEEIAQARKEAEARMTEQTEKLRQQNTEERNLREWRARNNLNVGTGTPNF